MEFCYNSLSQLEQPHNFLFKTQPFKDVATLEIRPSPIPGVCAALVHKQVVVVCLATLLNSLCEGCVVCFGWPLMSLLV